LALAVALLELQLRHMRFTANWPESLAVVSAKGQAQRGALPHAESLPRSALMPRFSTLRKCPPTECHHRRRLRRAAPLLILDAEPVPPILYYRRKWIRFRQKYRLGKRFGFEEQ